MNTSVRDHRHPIGQAPAAAGRSILHPALPGRRRPRALARIAAAATVLAASVLASSLVGGTRPAAAATVLPTPLDFVRQLNLQCFAAPGPAPQTGPVSRAHLSVALRGLLPDNSGFLGARQQLCVPVARTGAGTSLTYVNLACYQATGPYVYRSATVLPVDWNLLRTPASVRMMAPTQVCLPVQLNNQPIPPDMLPLVSAIALECYSESPGAFIGVVQSVRHVSPVLAGQPTQTVSINTGRQLCLPVQLNGQPMTPAVRSIVQWIALDRYDIAPPALSAPVPLQLRHLSPALSTLPPEIAAIQSANQLMLSMSVNGYTPPAS